MSLPLTYSGEPWEAGLDEAGRGCLAGPVVAAAVILPPDFSHEKLTDSKKLNAKTRERLREEIKAVALAWGVGVVSPRRIEVINIVNATFEAMHLAVDQMELVPSNLSVDGNRFINETGIPHHCLVKGDARFLNIAAASVLAKTHRDELMLALHDKFPLYGWDQNKGYPTRAHRTALHTHGPCVHHRKTFTWQAPPSLFETP